MSAIERIHLPKALSPSRSTAPGLASTGIAGLDDVLSGGLPTRHLFLVEGSPGTGKTTLALQFLLEGRDRGERGLYVTLSETAQELAQVAQSHGWSLEGIEIFDLLSDEGLSEEAEQTILHPSEVELGETTREVMRLVDELRPDRVVFDSLSELRLLAQSPLRYRRQILALKRFFAQIGCTVLMLDDKTSGDGDQRRRAKPTGAAGRCCAGASTLRLGHRRALQRKTRARTAAHGCARAVACCALLA